MGYVDDEKVGFNARLLLQDDTS